MKFTECFIQRMTPAHSIFTLLQLGAIDVVIWATIVLMFLITIVYEKSLSVGPLSKGLNLNSFISLTLISVTVCVMHWFSLDRFLQWF